MDYMPQLQYLMIIEVTQIKFPIMTQIIFNLASTNTKQNLKGLFHLPILLVFDRSLELMP